MMKIPFVKMHGLGNDFILIDCTTEQRDFLEDPAVIKRLCDRRFGIGADQVLIINPSSTSDCKMRIFNADGHEVEMCGNGIRCLAKYLHERNPSQTTFEIETLAGIIKPEIKKDQIVVDMGSPVLEGPKIPVQGTGNIIDKLVQVEGVDFRITCVSMGNPHCVIFCDDISQVSVDYYGPLLENHELFPQKTNVEFVQVIDRLRITMRVWERGSGITLACGTGACASAVASALNNKTDRSVTVFLDGGALDICWHESNHVYMTGPAEKVFGGEIAVSGIH